MSDDAPPRISSPASHSSVLAREMISSAKSDAPNEGAKAAARAKFEQFLAAEAHPKPPATDMPLFGSSTVDVLESAARSPVPSVANTHTKSSSTGAPPSSNDAFFASAAAAPKPAVPHEHHTGERNENSALFSLAQLSGEPEGHSAKSPASKPKSDVGVIDIKSMTNAKSAVDEILTVSAGSGLGSPLAAPMLAPVPAPNAAVASEPARSGGTNKTVVASVLGSMFILVGGGLAAMYILKSGQPQTQVGTEGSGPNTANAPNNGNGNNSNNGQNNNPGNSGSAANAGPNNAGTPSTNGAATAPGPAGTTQPAGTAPAGNEPSNRAERTPRATRSSTPSGSSNNSAPSSPSTSPTPSNNSPSTAPAGGSCAARCRGDIACLLSCGTQTRPASNGAPSTASSAPSNAPATPGRNDVIAAMRGVQSNVRQCAASTGQSGTASINVVFASSGRVTTANVAPPFAGTPTGSCMARAVRAAVVPPFSQPTFSVNYPFTL